MILRYRIIEILHNAAHNIQLTWHPRTWGQGDEYVMCSKYAVSWCVNMTDSHMGAGRRYSILVAHNKMHGGRAMSVWPSRYKGRCASLPTRSLSPCGVYVCERASMCVCLCVTVVKGGYLPRY
jgi:hypothetical protein